MLEQIDLNILVFCLELQVTKTYSNSFYLSIEKTSPSENVALGK